LHRLFARIKGFNTTIIPHVAARLKPANEPDVSIRETRLAPQCLLATAAEGTGVAATNCIAATNCRESPRKTLALLQHSRLIEYESHQRMR
jgi:hypothetical protein